MADYLNRFLFGGGGEGGQLLHRKLKALGMFVKQIMGRNPKTSVIYWQILGMLLSCGLLGKKRKVADSWYVCDAARERTPSVSVILCMFLLHSWWEAVYYILVD